MKELGSHLLIELYDCDTHLINDPAAVEDAMMKAARKAKATIVTSTFHMFSPHGVSGVVVIAESHVAIHTWPEHNYAAVDIFTCGKTLKPMVAYEFLKRAFKSENSSAIELKRGVIPSKEDKAKKLARRSKKSKVNA